MGQERYEKNLRDPEWCKKQLDSGMPPEVLAIFKALAGINDSYQAALARDRFAQAALSVIVNGKYLRQPALTDLAWYLHELDLKHQKEKGKPMTDDHLKQEAVKWARKHG